MPYLRISSDRSGEGLGVERQRVDCLALIEGRGWTLARAPFCENDASAAGRKPRPLFRALLDLVRSGGVDVIVAWSLDRLVRNARDRLALVEACRDAGVMIALCRGSDMDPTTPAGRLAIDVLGSVAQHEIDQKADRQRSAAQQAAENGRWIGGRRAFGYTADGLSIVEDEAAALRDAYAAVLAGETLRGVARQWNRAGFTTAQRPYRHAHLGERSPWRGDAVRRVLLNPRNAGLRAHKGEIMGQACWDGVVDESTWRATRTLLSDSARTTGGPTAMGKHFLSGVALCGLDGCGALVHGGGASHGKPVYRCRTTQLLPDQRPDVPGTHVNRLAAPADQYVSDVVVARLSRPDARDLLVDHKRADVPALREEATVLRARLDALAAEFGGGAEEPLPPREYRAMRAPLVEKIESIEGRIADAGMVDKLGALVRADDVAAAWDELTRDRRRAVLDVLAEVRLHAVGRGSRTFRPETVEIIWKAR
ncbi:DNA invertase Pin-like site-specific DNA recombinase [Pseudonocardia endophytica]|uniref:DNA invertase Pin-like site-specific DNA recombinase n=1 Tax=Pseudonocardia endophytica TaxID=401976 RepID=A0A4R1HTB1_PSEEN|nr:DNA invertase Pin-like site-specific DNA recombinase [Pseudonocardia endophytica]